MGVASCPAGNLRDAPPGAVLDTNVVLDWLLFRDARVSALVKALSDGAVVWLATEGMLAEVAHMLGHRSLARWESDREAALATCRRLARVLPALSGPRVGWPRCTDPDDQPFVDLAITEGARWLVSRDRALLKLGRRMQAHGVRVLVPEDWHAPPPALGAR